MGNHDNRRSMKMRRKIAQAKKKARLKKRKATRGTAKAAAPSKGVKKRAAAKE